MRAVLISRIVLSDFLDRVFFTSVPFFGTESVSRYFRIPIPKCPAWRRAGYVASKESKPPLGRMTYFEGKRAPRDYFRKPFLNELV